MELVLVVLDKTLSLMSVWRNVWAALLVPILVKWHIHAKALIWQGLTTVSEVNIKIKMEFVFAQNQNLSGSETNVFLVSFLIISILVPRLVYLVLQDFSMISILVFQLIAQWLKLLMFYLDSVYAHGIVLSKLMANVLLVLLMKFSVIILQDANLVLMALM